MSMKYDAFISYRHLEKDMFVAKGIHRALETAGIPRKIRKLTGKKRVQRVFRDQEELPIGSDLGENIEAALRESEFLVVICTPQTKESAWVMKEIDTFIALHGRENVLAVLAEGEPEDSFPHQIMTDDFGNPVEPLAADVRGENYREIRHKIKSESLRLVAAILGVDYEDLRRRRRERVMRRMVLAAAAVALAGTAFGAYNAYNLNRINENYRQKLINESRVLAKTSAEVLAEGDRKTAALIAMEGLPKEGDDRPLVADAEVALANALDCYSLGHELTTDRLLKHKATVVKCAINAEGTYIASYDAYYNYYIWDARTGEKLVEGAIIEKTDDNNSDRQKILGVGIRGNTAYFVAANELLAIDADGNEVYKVSFRKENYRACFDIAYKLVAVSSYDIISVYDTSTGILVGEKGRGTGNFFDFEMAFSEDCRQVAIVYQDTNMVAEIDIETDEKRDLTIWGNMVVAIGYTDDGGLVVASIMKSSYYDQDPAPMMVQRFDEDSSEPVFEKEYTFYNDNSYACDYWRIVSRTFSDDEGTHDQILIAAGKSLYTLDLHTGELINRYTVPESYITKMMYFPENENAFVCTYNGNLYLFNAETEATSEENAGNVGKRIVQLEIAGGQYVSTSINSPDIRILNIRADKAIEDVDSVRIGSLSLGASPDESTYLCAVSYKEGVDDDNNLVEITLYDSETDKKLDSFTAHGVRHEDVFYADEDTIMFTGASGAFGWYTISTGELHETNLDTDNYYWENAVSPGHKYQFFYATFDGVMLVDLSEKKKLIEGTMVLPGRINGAVVCDDKRVFISTINGWLYSLDPDTLETTLLEKNLHIGGVDNNIKLSSDEKYLLLCCSDGMVRLYDIENKTVVEEIEFYPDSVSSSFGISSDNSMIFLYGDDSYFRIFDRNTHDFMVEMSASRVTETGMEEYTQKNELAFGYYNGMYIFDLDNYSLLGKFPGGATYISKYNKVIIYESGGKLRKVRRRTYEELIEEAKEQFGEDAALTPAQKRKYNIG